MRFGKTLKSALAMGIIFAMAAPAVASPTVYRRPHSRVGEVQNNTVAPVIGDHEIDDEFYVLPPGKGSTEVANITYGANIGFCREMADIQAANRYITQRIGNMTDEITELYDEIEVLREEQGEYRRRMADLYQDDDVRTAVDLQDTMSVIEFAMAGLQMQYAGCYESDDAFACMADVRAELTDLMRQRTEVMRAYVEARRAAAAKYSEYVRAKRSVDVIDDEIEELENDVDRKAERLVNLHGTLRSLYDGYGRLEGALVQVVFDSGWDEAVAQLRRENPGFSFERIPTRNARVDLALVPGLNQETTVPPGRIVLGYTVDGVTYDPANPTHFMGGYPGSHAAHVSTSLIGACFYAHPEYFDMDANTPAGTPAFGLTVRYQYPSSFYTHAWGSYDKWESYQYLKRVEESGFLWWKETEVSEDIDGDGEGCMEINIESEEDISSQQLQGMRNQIRMELLQQVMMEFGEPQYDAAAPPAMIRPTSGVEVLAAGVYDTCGWYNIICNGVRWVLRGLDAIMPGPDAEVRFESMYRYRESFDYSTDVVRWMPATTTFTDLVEENSFRPTVLPRFTGIVLRTAE